MLIESNKIDTNSSSSNGLIKQQLIISENSNYNLNGIEEIIEAKKFENGSIKNNEAFTNSAYLIEKEKKRQGFSTIAIHAGIVPQRWDMHQVCFDAVFNN